MHTTRQALRVALLLTERPMTRYDVAEALGVHDRTALRILQMLVDLGVADASQTSGRTMTMYRVPRGRRFSDISA